MIIQILTQAATPIAILFMGHTPATMLSFEFWSDRSYLESSNTVSVKQLSVEREAAHLAQENAKLRRQQERFLEAAPAQLPKKNTLYRTSTAPF
ncbi:hypothetical protein POTOM_020130 [Populus tomentosa]|uniref:Uncharacterized protein n=1 Tax=Populus tomentosa TaxID=118781 RepID=A0A8X7ZVA7_POPTO|nr:hypothetical protein POTOM_020130 [Populus tomentosa]